MPYGTFKEEQRFTQVWVWIVLLGVSAIVLYTVPSAIIHQSEENPISTTHAIVLAVSVLIVIGLLALFFFARLTTKINNDVIEITYRPLILKAKVFRWDEIDEAFVRKYNSLWEYGGWGIRYSFKGRAYNTSGNMGLQLILKSGKKILIGTQKPEELEAFLKKYIFVENTNIN